MSMTREELIKAAKNNWIQACVLRVTDPELAKFMDGMDTKDMEHFNCNTSLWKKNNLSRRKYDVYRLRADYEEQEIKFKVGSVWLYHEDAIKYVWQVVDTEKNKETLPNRTGPLIGKIVWPNCKSLTDVYANSEAARDSIPFYAPADGLLERENVRIVDIRVPKFGERYIECCGRLVYLYKSDCVDINYFSGLRYIVEPIEPEPEKEILLPVELTKNGVIIRTDEEEFKYARAGAGIEHNDNSYLVEGFIFEDGIESCFSIIWRYQKERKHVSYYKTSYFTVREIATHARCTLIEKGDN